MERSEVIKDLAASLVAAQGELPNVTKESLNPYFKSKYADLATIMDVIRPILAKNGLSVFNTMGYDINMPDKVIVNTFLMHKSGQWISGSNAMSVGRGTPQDVGSAMTYARRYGIQAILGVAAELDDDGASASGTVARSAAKEAQAVMGGELLATPEELANLEAVAKAAQLGIVKILEYWKVDKLQDMTSPQVAQSIKTIKEQSGK